MEIKMIRGPMRLILTVFLAVGCNSGGEEVPSQPEDL